MEEQCRLQKKTLACSPGGAQASRLQPPALPQALGVVPGVARILSLAGMRKLFFPHIFCQVVFRSAWFEPTCHSLDPPR